MTNVEHLTALTPKPNYSRRVKVSMDVVVVEVPKPVAEWSFDDLAV